MESFASLQSRETIPLTYDVNAENWINKQIKIKGEQKEAHQDYQEDLRGKPIRKKWGCESHNKGLENLKVICICKLEQAGSTSWTKPHC